MVSKPSQQSTVDLVDGYIQMLRDRGLGAARHYSHHGDPPYLTGNIVVHPEALVKWIRNGGKV
jgi:hypothetical protein